jgi:prefoldin subunit 5
MEEIRDAYDEEKHEYEAQANLLRQEVEELQSALDDEDKNRKKIDELKKANNKLQQERRLVHA